MKEHRYGVTVTYLETADGEKPEVEPISFEVLNHDDIFRIIGLMNESKILPPEDAKAFVVGLKLFTDVAMKHRDEPLFAAMKPYIGDIMKTLKRELKARGVVKKPEAK